jgi:methionine--tRNA ligase
MPAQAAYVTTPIFYCNDRPHIGHTYTTTLCDVYARFMRLAGRDVFFLTGTDEHGLKVERAAQQRGMTPQQLADENSAVFREVLPVFRITNDDFIRTTELRHERQVQALIRRLLESGDIYLGKFQGWYDEGQEEYYTETKARELNYTSPVTSRPLTRATEKNYYFRLAAYQARLERLFADRPEFVRPEARRNEVLGRLREGLQDVPVSRTNFTWGIPMPPPAEPGHVIYVWIDALLNYVTALGLGEADSGVRRERERFWPATYHVIGKEILWFHAVIWPAMLMALGLDVPRCVYAHSFWISEGQKMSKTLGNFIDLPTIERYISTYGLDAWRYYMIAQGPLGAQDADFAAAHFHEVFTTDLVNTVGNCASRVTTMIGKYFDGEVPSSADGPARPEAAAPARRAGAGSGERSDLEADWPTVTARGVAHITLAYEQFDLSGALAGAVALLRRVDAYINATEPFKLARDPANRPRLGAILYRCIETVRIASLLLWPVMPRKMEELWAALGVTSPMPRGDRSAADVPLAAAAQWGGLKPGTRVQKVALFPRVELKPAPGAQPVSA